MITRSPITRSPDYPIVVSLPLDRAVLAHQRRQNRVDALLHFSVGQRAVGCLKRQPDREADRRLGYALAPIPIEEARCDEGRRQVAAGGENGATNDLRRQDVRYDD